MQTTLSSETSVRHERNPFPYCRDTRRTFVILGDSGVGKTALIQRYLHNNFDAEDHDLTIETSYAKNLSNDKKVEILDTAGIHEYRSLLDDWIQRGDGFMLVYSISSHISFDYVIRTYKRIKEIKGDALAPVVLVGNKCDMVEQRDVTSEDGATLAVELKAEFFETSAKLGTESVRESFCGLFNRVFVMERDREGSRESGSKFWRWFYPDMRWLKRCLTGS